MILYGTCKILTNTSYTCVHEESLFSLQLPLPLDSSVSNTNVMPSGDNLPK